MCELSITPSHMTGWPASVTLWHSEIIGGQSYKVSRVRWRIGGSFGGYAPPTFSRQIMTRKLLLRFRRPSLLCHNFYNVNTNNFITCQSFPNKTSKFWDDGIYSVFKFINITDIISGSYNQCLVFNCFMTMAFFPHSRDVTKYYATSTTFLENVEKIASTIAYLQDVKFRK